MPNFTVRHADGTDTFNGDDDTDGIGPRQLSPESADIACMACGTPCVDLTHHRDAWRDSGHRTLAYGETRSPWQPFTADTGGERWVERFRDDAAGADPNRRVSTSALRLQE